VQRNADETLVREILASGHYLDSASHRLFTDRDRQLADESPVEILMYLCFAKCRWFISGPRITSCSSLEFRR
ncbi:hypothetical protein HAX54_001217, partial [Datura stramonium]|nr:hypothetical protein [Datura stramonium]